MTNMTFDPNAEDAAAIATVENRLSPELTARFERIKSLAKQNRRQYAIEKADAVKSVRAAKPKSKASPVSRRKLRKDRKPFYYNPAHRD